MYNCILVNTLPCSLTHPLKMAGVSSRAYSHGLCSQTHVGSQSLGKFLSFFFWISVSSSLKWALQYLPYVLLGGLLTSRMWGVGTRPHRVRAMILKNIGFAGIVSMSPFPSPHTFIHLFLHLCAIHSFIQSIWQSLILNHHTTINDYPVCVSHCAKNYERYRNGLNVYLARKDF